MTLPSRLFSLSDCFPPSIGIFQKVTTHCQVVQAIRAIVNENVSNFKRMIVLMGFDAMIYVLLNHEYRTSIVLSLRP